ncbi:MAG: hypothetical protein LUD17_14430 [Bacteroidales bacterium]|nr:hypothetical protein [Bacteroidales bacterium]
MIEKLSVSQFLVDEIFFWKIGEKELTLRQIMNQTNKVKSKKLKVKPRKRKKGS